MILKRIFKRWTKQPVEKKSTTVYPNNDPGIELWEEDYLVKKIQVKYTNVSEESIRNAVRSCYAIFRSPQSAEMMVNYVISKLSSQELQSAQVEY